MNADGFLQTGQGMLDKNMFAYCANNPASRSDPYGTNFLSTAIQFLTSNPYTALIALSIVAVSAVCGITILSQPQVQNGLSSTIDNGMIGQKSIEIIDGIKPQTQTKAKAKAESKADTNKKPSKQAYFPSNPNNFNPRGLEKNVRVDIGTGKNGGIIQWRIPGTKITVFEWNEDYRYGNHYHTLKIEWDNEHIGPHHEPNSKIPEPWNSLYF